MNKGKPEFLEGGTVVDDRGELSFCNDFDMSSIKRFYRVSNHTAGFVRGWHGHKRESKYIYVGSGAALVAAVKIDNWDAPNPKLDVETFVVSDKKPGLLFIPSGYAHAYKTLTNGAQLFFFSSATLGESLDDDYRYDALYWDPWKINYR